VTYFQYETQAFYTHTYILNNLSLTWVYHQIAILPLERKLNQYCVNCVGFIYINHINAQKKLSKDVWLPGRRRVGEELATVGEQSARSGERLCGWTTWCGESVMPWISDAVMENEMEKEMRWFRFEIYVWRWSEMKRRQWAIEGFWYLIHLNLMIA